MNFQKIFFVKLIYLIFTSFFGWTFFKERIWPTVCFIQQNYFPFHEFFFRFGIFSSIADYIIMNFVLAYLRRQFPNTPTMNTSDFSEIIKDNENILILDCRRPDEHEISKIPGAKNVHFRCSDEELKEALKEVDDKTQIINYCSLGYR